MTGMKLLRNGTLWLLTGVLLTLCAAGEVFAAQSKEAAATIESFYADPAVVGAGETATLHWKVTNASAIEILGIEKEPEELGLEDSLEVWPLTTTSYILIAHGLDGNAVSKAFTVNVDLKNDVNINYFKASATQIACGDLVTLSWKVSNGVSVRIIGISDKDDECVRSTEGSVLVWPTETTTYLLEATGANGAVASAAVTVNVGTVVVTEPEILSFTASKYEIGRGDLVILSWKTKNAIKCTLTTGSVSITNRPANGSIAVTPNKTKTFTLIAYDAADNQVEKSLTITVK
jgi:hypothetical protein